MTMMDNAITSIELGVEDYVNSDPRRLTSAMRNVSAGILLLLKCVLLHRSPPGSDGVLIYQHFKTVTLPDGSKVDRPAGRKTVDVFTLKKRFEDLGIDFDWEPLDTIVAIRNEIEHFHTTEPAALVREALAAALPLIQTVLTDYLGETAADVFDEACWSTLREVKEIFDRQLAASQSTFGAVEWDSEVLAEAMKEFRCTDCGSSLVRQLDADNAEVEKILFECVDCREAPAWDEVLEKAIVAASAHHNYRAVKDGDDPPVTACFECGRAT